MLRLASSVNNAACYNNRWLLRRSLLPSFLALLVRPVAIAAALTLAVLAPALAAALSPETVGTGTYVYQVTRDGEVVGEQRADFERRGDALSVITEVRINITLLGLSIYDF